MKLLRSSRELLRAGTELVNLPCGADHLVRHRVNLRVDADRALQQILRQQAVRELLDQCTHLDHNVLGDHLGILGVVACHVRCLSELRVSRGDLPRAASELAATRLELIGAVCELSRALRGLFQVRSDLDNSVKGLVNEPLNDGLIQTRCHLIGEVLANERSQEAVCVICRQSCDSNARICAPERSDRCAEVLWDLEHEVVAARFDSFQRVSRASFGPRHGLTVEQRFRHLTPRVDLLSLSCRGLVEIHDHGGDVIEV